MNAFFTRLIFVSSLFIANTTQAQFQFNNAELTITLDKKGNFTSFVEKSTGKNLLYKDTVSPLLTLVSNGKKLAPSSASFNSSSQKIILQFGEANVRIEINVKTTASHISFEISKAEPENKVEAVLWGPYSNTIGKTVGEIIGVVRDGTTALGLQVLNVKTMGGNYPNREGSSWSRGMAAVTTAWGSQLQAYSINRSRKREVDAWGGNYTNMPVEPIAGETVVGSKIGLFVCREPETLNRLEAIELAEGLPHPTIDGVWFKKSRMFGKSYMISDFNEENIDEMIGYAKRSGLVSLYHEGPFQSWGHFVLDPKSFSNGRQGLKNCVEKAHRAGLFLGVHTLTNFINTNDPYVSPVPDKRLSITGSSILTKEITADATSLEVASPEFFNDTKFNSLHTVRIGEELIRYKNVSTTAPYLLQDCQRGAFGTKPGQHTKGTEVSKLFDHPYQVFFPNFNLQREVAGNLSRFLNETGVDHWDFDGHEGGLASGQGDYGIELFAKDVFDSVKHDVLIGTSNSKTFYWHIGSYYNWGEPWYGGFKESMQQYRIDNQGLFDRNYMPHMLGWYLMTENTTLSEMEWMLARAAGYGAGFAMVARPNALRKNPNSGQLLDAMREWELARTGGAFTEQQKEALKDPKKEFHLEKQANGKWLLQRYLSSSLFVRDKVEKQPGEPTLSQWVFDQPWQQQVLQCRLFVSGNNGSAGNFKLQLDNYRELKLPVELKAGESLVVDGSNSVRLYDANGKPKGIYKLEGSLPRMDAGKHEVSFDCAMEGEVKVELSFRGLDPGEISSRTT